MPQRGICTRILTGGHIPDSVDRTIQRLRQKPLRISEIVFAVSTRKWASSVDKNAAVRYNTGTGAMRRQ